MKKISFFPSLAAVSLISLLSPCTANGALVRGGATQTAISGVTRGSAVAYDSLNKVYLVVGSHGALYGRFVLPDGTPTGAQFYIPAVAGVFAAFPRVAFSPDADGGNGAFLVTWNQSATPAATVHVRLVSYVRGGPFGEDSVVGSGSFFESGCAVAYATRSREFLVVWQNVANLPDIVGVRLNNAAQLIASVAIPHTPDGERDPTVAYDPDDDQFLVVYSGYNNAYSFVGARRVQAGTGAVLDNGERITVYQTVGTYITEVAYNTRLKKYLASWHAKPANASLGQLVSPSGTLTGTTIALSTRWTAYDAMGIAYNAISDSFFAVSHNATTNLPAEDGGVELNSNGTPVDNGFVVTADGARNGNFYPKVAASPDAPDWLLSAAKDFGSAITQRVTGNAAGAAPPPPPPAPAPLSISSVTVNPATTVAIGSPVTVSVASSGGVGPIQYQFWRYSYTTQSWTLAQAWSTSNQVSWTPGMFDGGWYKVQAWARSAGGTTFEAWMDSAQFRVVTPQPRVLSFHVSANASASGAAPTGSPVTVSALASAGISGTVEYQFWRLNTGTGRWALDRPWSTNNSYVWLPGATDEGTFVFQVWVRDGSADWQDWASTELLVSNLRVTNFTASATSIADGKPVGFNVTAVGNPTGQYEYKFWRYNVPTGQWSVIRDYTTSSAFVWVPTSRDQGADNIQVWVRSAGSHAFYAAWSMISIRVTPP